MSKQEQFAYEMICRFQRGEVTREDVANMLETTPRNISRISKRVKEKGMLGIKHGNTSRPPVNKDSKSHKRMVQDLLEKYYFDFNIVHAKDMLKQHHNLDIKYTTLRRMAHNINLVKHRKKIETESTQYSGSNAKPRSSPSNGRKSPRLEWKKQDCSYCRN